MSWLLCEWICSSVKIISFFLFINLYAYGWIYSHFSSMIMDDITIFFRSELIHSSVDYYGSDVEVIYIFVITFPLWHIDTEVLILYNFTDSWCWIEIRWQLSRVIWSMMMNFLNVTLWYKFRRIFLGMNYYQVKVPKIRLNLC